MTIPDSPLGDPDYPLRPTHRDFGRLVELVLELDAQADAVENAEGTDVNNIVERVIDPESISYMAVQRALRVGQAIGQDPVARGAGLYLEGFIMGYRYRAKYGADHA